MTFGIYRPPSAARIAGPHNPPPARPGYRWEWREGCNCANCPWQPYCVGTQMPHWREVKE